MLIQFSYHTAGYIAGALLATGLFLYLINLRGKSNQTWFLAAYFLLYMCLNIGFVLRTAVYDPAFAKPSSYLIGLYTAFSNVALLLFVYHFPTNRHKLESRLAVGLITLTGAASYIYYIVRTAWAPVHYNFETQFFQFQNPEAARPMGLQLLVTFVWVLSVIIRKTIREEKLHRSTQPESSSDWGFVFSYLRLTSRSARALRAFSVAVFLNLCFSATYVLYTARLLSYADFQQILTAATSIQLFLYAVIYLNNSPQPTSFMVKLVGIAIVTVMLVLALVSRITYRYNERLYDAERTGHALLASAAVDSKDFSKLPGEILFMASTSSAQTAPPTVHFSHDRRINAHSLRSSDENSARMLAGPSLQSLHETGRFASGARPRRGYRALQPDTPASFYVVYRFAYRDRFYELGYGYADYRESVHGAAARMSGILAGTSLALLIIFPFFFHSGLVSPLKRLLGAMRLVNAGDYQATITVQVEDEIGFLSRSFNSMVDSIRTKNAQLNDYANDLEAKVADRTEELQQSLAEVRKLKIRQDGDYYLTSLLIEPLARNQVKSDSVSVDFLLKQRKSFQYSKWQAEIGGDICIAKSIELGGKTHTAFLNADAMGKSIQGAGGALVIGAVFESILKRTESSQTMRQMFPERWLKSAYQELAAVFASFRGGMMVTAICGLVDDQTGFTYYLQAEHPDPVLYRQGRARLLTPKHRAGKLGMPLHGGDQFTNTLRLQPGDLLLLGSDGRDDLEIIDRTGQPVIQEDPQAFVRAVEAAEGDLAGIEARLLATGKLLDDLSFIRIEYHPAKKSQPQASTPKHRYEQVRAALRLGRHAEAMRLLESDHNGRGTDLRRLRHLIRACLRAGDVERGLEHALAYAALEPAHAENLITVSKCYEQLGDMRAAIDYAERVHLRRPEHVSNLERLIRLHNTAGEPGRARALASGRTEPNPAARPPWSNQGQ